MKKSQIRQSGMPHSHASNSVARGVQFSPIKQPLVPQVNHPFIMAQPTPKPKYCLLGISDKCCQGLSCGGGSVINLAN